ncbi:MAG: FtsX-like permease family protein [Firmicutes bacterium]|nr:FtsX-like permease family protein [Bacillota bacterium]
MQMSMGFRDYLRLALSSLYQNKLRSALTLLGIVIGVASVITMVSIGEGARTEVTSQLEGLGSTMLFIQPNYFDQDVMMGQVVTISPEDVELLRQSSPALVYVSPQITARGVIKFASEEKKTTIVCTNDELAWMQGLAMDEGRFFSQSDIQSRRAVVVLGRDLADYLFGNMDPLGRRVRVNDTICSVIGIMKKRGQRAFSGGMDTEDMYAYLPITLARRALGVDQAQVVLTQAKDVNSVRDAKEQMENFLRRRFGRGHKFRVESAESMLESAKMILGILTAILGGIGSISLLVGGIGVMNIMMVTVTERTREIGIRKAIGAKNSHILRQFVTEAVVLCLVGGIVGILLGAIGAKIVSALSPIPAVVSPFAIIIAFASSSLVGLIFGVYPAYKAANLDPIQALRHE